MGYDDLTLDVKAPRATETQGRAERIEYRYRKAGAEGWGDWTTYPTGLTPQGTSRLAAAYDEGDSRVNSQTYRLHLTDLDHDTAYDLQVRSVNSVGASDGVSVAGIRTEGLRARGENAYLPQAGQTPAPSAPAAGQRRFDGGSTFNPVGPVASWPSQPTWIDAWATGTAYAAGDRVRLTTGTHTRYMQCTTAHTAQAGGLTLSAANVLAGSQLASWKEAHWDVHNRAAPVDQNSYWYSTNRGLTYVPTWFVGVRNDAFRSTQSFASGSAAPTGSTGKWYLQTGTAPVLWFLNGATWVRILDAVSYGTGEPTASTGDVYVQTGTWIVWRRIAYAGWVRVVDPRSLFGTGAGIRTVAGEKYATVRTTDDLDGYLDDSTVNQVLHLSSRSVNDGVLAGIFYAKAYRDKASSVISALPVDAEGQAFEFTTATQAAGVVTIEARPKTSNTAQTRQTMRRFFEMDHAARVGDWQALFADAATSTDTGTAWRWTFTGVAAGSVSPTETLEIIEAVFARYECDDDDQAIHMVYFESRAWSAPVNYRMPPAATPAITASGTYRSIGANNYEFALSASVTGGVAPYTVAWEVRNHEGFSVARGSGSAITLIGNLLAPPRPGNNEPSAVVTVTDSSSPAKTATAHIPLTAA